VHECIGEKFCIRETTMLIHEPGTVRGAWRAAKDELTTIWMFSPYTIQNGGHLVLPGSHHQPAPAPDRNDVSPRPSEGVATGKSGDVLVLAPGTWHAVAANDDGDAPRICIVVTYARAEGDPRTWPRHESSVLLDRQLQRIPDAVRPLFRHWVS
jgi:ectoine hydroxylase-related dioxygenase (phytanoyl-CoA dioxygenase family)